jgi:GTP-binding protein
MAITEDIPGTTRDRLYADITWRDSSFTLVDTGGLLPIPPTDITQLIKEQVEVVIEEADAIILLVDVVDGLTIMDKEVAELLRRTKKPVVIAVNKVDNEQRNLEIYQFYELALGDPLPVSAYHGLGIDELLDKVAQNLPYAPVEEEPEMMKVAIVGRPNVGKSTLLNAILGEERAIVSERPGTTRDAIDIVYEYGGERMLLIDTAGIRKRGQVEVGIERYSVMRALRAISRSDVSILVTDATEGVTAQDAHVAGYIQQACKGIVLAVNKWDMVDPSANRAEWTREIRAKLRFVAYAPVIYISAKLKRGINGVLKTATEVYAERTKRIPTPMLNNAIRDAVATHAPPSVAGRRFKILYVTQAEINPPTFVFFVNDPKMVHFSYKRYLENSLRQRFGFQGTALRLLYRRRGEE